MATVSFANDIAPTLFKYRGQMAWRLDLASYDDVKANAALIAGQLAPGFDLSHIGRFGEALEPFASLGARFVAWQAKALPPPGVLSGCRGRTPAAPVCGAFGELDWLLGPGCHPGPLRAIG